jgi:hypothetical protein
MVKALSAYGTPQEEIAGVIDIHSPKTLRRHFRTELNKSATEANAQVAQTLHQMAVSGKHPTATIFWLKVRAKWREETVVSPPTAVAPPFIVSIEGEP